MLFYRFLVIQCGSTFSATLKEKNRSTHTELNKAIFYGRYCTEQKLTDMYVVVYKYLKSNAKKTSNWPTDFSLHSVCVPTRHLHLDVDHHRSS